MKKIFLIIDLLLISLSIITIFNFHKDKVNYFILAPSKMNILFKNNNPKPMTTRDICKSKAIDLITNYGIYLQNGNIEEILKLYSPDAEIIPDGLSSLTNKKNIEIFYKNTFQTIKLHGNLKIKEVMIFDTIALVRCEEPAEVEILATGQKEKSYFRELFILRKENNNWKILKYMFSQISQN